MTIRSLSDDKNIYELGTADDFPEAVADFHTYIYKMREKGWTLRGAGLYYEIEHGQPSGQWHWIIRGWKAKVELERPTVPRSIGSA